LGRICSSCIRLKTELLKNNTMNIRSINLLESFETYECHGEIQINLDLFPELVGRSDTEIDTWLNANYSSLFINCRNSELRREKPIKQLLETPNLKLTTSNAATPLAPAVVKVLHRCNRPMRVCEIIVELERDGYQWTAKNPEQTLLVRITKLIGIKSYKEGYYIAEDINPETLLPPSEELDPVRRIKNVIISDDSSSYGIDEIKKENPEDIIKLSDYWDNCEVIWKKYKNETRSMSIIPDFEDNE